MDSSQKTAQNTGQLTASITLPLQAPATRMPTIRSRHRHLPLPLPPHGRIHLHGRPRHLSGIGHRTSQQSALQNCRPNFQRRGTPQGPLPRTPLERQGSRRQKPSPRNPLERSRNSSMAVAARGKGISILVPRTHPGNRRWNGLPRGKFGDWMHIYQKRIEFFSFLLDNPPAKREKSPWNP